MLLHKCNIHSLLQATAALPSCPYLVVLGLLPLPLTTTPLGSNVQFSSICQPSLQSTGGFFYLFTCFGPPPRSPRLKWIKSKNYSSSLVTSITELFMYFYDIAQHCMGVGVGIPQDQPAKAWQIKLYLFTHNDLVSRTRTLEKGKKFLQNPHSSFCYQPYRSCTSKELRNKLVYASRGQWVTPLLNASDAENYTFTLHIMFQS